MASGLAANNWNSVCLPLPESSCLAVQTRDTCVWLETGGRVPTGF